MRRTTSLSMGIPKASVICCAIRGHPQLGFVASYRDGGDDLWLGPWDPFHRLLRAKETAVLPLDSALSCRLNSVDGLKTIAERINRLGG